MLRLRTLGALQLERAGRGGDDASRPRRLALLAILTASSSGGVGRDRVLGILWPDRNEERARHALSQTLYGLRQDVGGEVVTGTTELRVDRGLLGSDLADFRAAVADRDWERAAALYQGPFLDGFYLADAPEFDRWVDGERAALARDGVTAIEGAASRAAPAPAAEYWWRLTTLEPLSARYAIGYMKALVALGERARALGHAKAHVDYVRAELEGEPDSEVLELAAELRGGSASPRPEPRIVAAPAASEVSVPARPPVRSARHLRSVLVLGVAAVAVSGFLLWRSLTPGSAEVPRPTLAVGHLRDLVAPDSVALGGVLGDMLATSLGRLTDLQVVGTSRLLELLPPGGDTSRAARTTAARQAGATEVLEGEIARGNAGMFRLDLRRVDLRTGVVRRGYLVYAADRHALVDSVTALVANDLRMATPEGSVAQVTTRSPIAYRLYENGLRTYFQYDVYAARSLFDAAVREDSNFAMAAYYSWLTAVESNDRGFEQARHALRVARRASDRDRLLIQTHIALSDGDPAALVTAESLATRFPSDPEALTNAAAAMAFANHPVGRPIALFERAIAIDSAAGSGQAASCRLCRALLFLTDVYAHADSAAAAERTLRRWTRLAPTDPRAWSGLGERLFRRGEVAEGIRMTERAVVPGQARNPVLDAIVRAMLRDDWEAFGEPCGIGLGQGTSATDWGQYRWYCAIGLRARGRYRDALALIRGNRAPGTELVRRDVDRDLVNEAILDYEMGRPRLAALAFSRFAEEWRANQEVAPGIRARHVTWNSALTANALIAAGDSVEANALADSVERSGRESLYGRDPHLHHFVRGRLLSKAGKHDSALVELRLAISSWPLGFTRINYELAGSAIAVGKPNEAIYPLQAALRGGLDGPQLYVTRTELHERLAEAFAATDQADSAAAHYRTVVKAWANADPFLQPRLAAARAWLARRR